MASYHLSAQPVKRSEGRSVVAMAAYRAGVRLKDERRGAEVDYRRRRGVAHTEVLVPEGCADWLRDRETLWNYVERIENRRDAQLAREINMALPHELTDQQRIELVRKFAGEQFVKLGMVVDFAIHKPVAEKGDDPRNYHAHLLLTLRQAEAGGLRRVKTREWNSDKMLVAWREAWAACQNEALREHGHKASVDHRSLAVRKAEAARKGDRVEAIVLDRAPEIHVGPKARKAGRAGPPQSRDRLVGPSRKKATGPAKRKLRYTEIDKGSRGEWNIRRLSANAETLETATAKTEKRLARLRRKLGYYERQVHVHSVPAPKPKRSWKPRPKPVDVVDLFTSRESKLKHARKRKQQVAWLINELDKMFRALLGIRENALMRRMVWQNRLKRWRPNDFKPSRGGGRQRSRLLPP